jgi:hypothetical protein
MLHSGTGVMKKMNCCDAKFIVYLGKPDFFIKGGEFLKKDF